MKPVTPEEIVAALGLLSDLIQSVHGPDIAGDILARLRMTYGKNERADRVWRIVRE